MKRSFPHGIPKYPIGFYPRTMNPNHILTNYVFQIHFKNFLSLTPDPFKQSPPFGS